MERKELPIQKLQARRGSKLDLTCHPIDSGYERLLTPEEVSRIIPDWILEKRRPTHAEWESAIWLSEVIRHKNTRTRKHQNDQLPTWSVVVSKWPMGPENFISQTRRHMEAPPDSDSLQTLFEQITKIDNETDPAQAGPQHVHTRVRTAYGSYTVEELRTATPRQLSRRPSTQVRDYLNARDKPIKAWALTDLRPKNRRLRHTWQAERKIPENQRHITGEGQQRDGTSKRTYNASAIKQMRDTPPHYLPPCWWQRRHELHEGWVYTPTTPATASGSWSHEATGAWFLNINGDCYPWKQEFDTVTGKAFLWLPAVHTPLSAAAFFWIHDQMCAP